MAQYYLDCHPVLVNASLAGLYILFFKWLTQYVKDMTIDSLWSPSLDTHHHPAIYRAKLTQNKTAWSSLVEGDEQLDRPNS